MDRRFFSFVDLDGRFRVLDANDISTAMIDRIGKSHWQISICFKSDNCEVKYNIDFFNAHSCVQYFNPDLQLTQEA